MSTLGALVLLAVGAVLVRRSTDRIKSMQAEAQDPGQSGGLELEAPPTGGFGDRSSSHGSAMHRISVQVVDCAGRPLPAVCVRATDDGGRVECGTTDSTGLASLVLTGSGVQQVTLHRTPDSPAETSARLDGPIPPELTMVLDPGSASISGTVRHASRPAPGIRIAALPKRVWRSIMADPGALLAYEGLSWTEADEHGHFRLCGLEPVAYVLAVGGAGLCCEGRLIDVDLASQSRSLGVEVVRPLAMRIVLADAVHGRLRLSEFSEPTCQQVSFALPEEARRIDPAWPHLVLAGYPVECARAATETITAFYVNPDHARSGSATVEAEAWACGYARTRVACVPTGLQHAGEAQQVRLVPLSRDIGSLTLHIQGLAPCAHEPSGLRRDAFSVRLVRAAAPRDHLEYRIPASAGPSVTIDGIPHGRYGITVESPGMALLDTNLRERHQEVQVSPDMRVIEFRAPPNGCVLLEAAQADGTPYTGELQARVYQVGSRPGAFRLSTFEGPPYRLPGLPAGECSLRVEQPGEVAPERLTGLVTPGAEVTLPVLIRPWRGTPK